jgi:thiol-disulfide isomerase/thioredoxin
MTNPESVAPKSRRTLLLILAAVAAALLYALFHFASNSDAKKDQTGIARFARGTLAGLQTMPKPPKQPDIAFKDAAGKDVRLADFRGKILLLNVWATWCTPCKAEMPTLAALAGSQDDGQFAVVAVSIDKADATDKARTFISGLQEPKLEFYQDVSGNMAFDVQAAGVPVTVIYDRAGAETARLTGPADWAGPEAKALMAELVRK